LVAEPGSHWVHDVLASAFAYEPGSHDRHPLLPLEFA